MQSFYDEFHPAAEHLGCLFSRPKAKRPKACYAKCIDGFTAVKPRLGYGLVMNCKRRRKLWETDSGCAGKQGLVALNLLVKRDNSATVEQRLTASLL